MFAWFTSKDEKHFLLLERLCCINNFVRVRVRHPLLDTIYTGAKQSLFSPLIHEHVRFKNKPSVNLFAIAKDNQPTALTLELDPAHPVVAN